MERPYSAREATKALKETAERVGRRRALPAAEGRSKVDATLDRIAAEEWGYDPATVPPPPQSRPVENESRSQLLDRIAAEEWGYDPSGVTAPPPPQRGKTGGFGRTLAGGAIGLGSAILTGADEVMQTNPAYTLGRRAQNAVLGFDPMESARTALKGAEDYQYDQLSPENRAALNRTFTGEGGILEGGPGTVRSLALKTTQSAPSLAVSILPVAIAARTGMTLKSLAAMGGAIEGVMGAGYSANDAAESIGQMDEPTLQQYFGTEWDNAVAAAGGDKQAARQSLVDKGKQEAARVGGSLSAIFGSAGAAATGRILNATGVTPAVTAAIKAATDSGNRAVNAVGKAAALGVAPATTRLGAAGKALLPGALQEGAQEVGEGVGSRYAQNRPLLEGAGEEFVGGAVLGGLVDSAVSGAVGPRRQTALPLEDSAPSTQPEVEVTPSERAEFEAEEARIAAKQKAAAEKAAKEAAAGTETPTATEEVPPAQATATVASPNVVTPTPDAEQADEKPSTPVRTLDDPEAPTARQKAADVLDKVAQAIGNSRTKDEKRQAANRGFAARIPAVQKAVIEGDWTELRVLMTEVSQSNPRIIPPKERSQLATALDNQNLDDVLSALDAIDSKLTRKRDKISGLQPLKPRPAATNAQEELQQLADIAEESESRKKINKDGTEAKTRIVPLDERQTHAAALIAGLRTAVNSGYLQGAPDLDKRVRVALAEYANVVGNARHAKLDDIYAALVPLAKEAAAATSSDAKPTVVVESAPATTPKAPAEEKKPRGKVTLTRKKGKDAPATPAPPRPDYPFFDIEGDIRLLQQRLKGTSTVSQIMADLNGTARGQQLRGVLETYVAANGKKSSDKEALAEAAEQLREDQLAAQIREQRAKKKAAKEAAKGLKPATAVSGQATTERKQGDEEVELDEDEQEVAGDVGWRGLDSDEVAGQTDELLSDIFDNELTQGTTSAGGRKLRDEVALLKRNGSPDVKAALAEIDADEAAAREQINASNATKEQKAAARDALKSQTRERQQELLDDLRGADGVLPGQERVETDEAGDNDWAFSDFTTRMESKDPTWEEMSARDEMEEGTRDYIKRLKNPAFTDLLRSRTAEQRERANKAIVKIATLLKSGRTLTVESVLDMIYDSLPTSDPYRTLIRALRKSGVDWSKPLVVNDPEASLDAIKSYSLIFGTANSGTTPVMDVTTNKIGSLLTPGDVDITDFGLMLALDGAATDYSRLSLMTILIHEATHIATVQRLEEGGPAVEELILLYNKSKASAEAKGLGEMYGHANLFEFVAEAMASPDFQAWLSTVNTPIEVKGQHSHWSEFVAAMKRLLHLPFMRTSVLDHVFNLFASKEITENGNRFEFQRGDAMAAIRSELLTNEVLHQRVELEPWLFPRGGENINSYVNRLRDADREDVLQAALIGVQKKAEDNAARSLIYDGNSLRFNGARVKMNRVIDGRRYQVRNDSPTPAPIADRTLSKMRGGSLWVHSFNDIVDRFARAFEVGGSNLLKKYQASLQERNAIVTEHRRDIDKLLQRWRSTISTEMWPRFNSVLKTSTMEQIDPTKPWAEQEWANKKYAPETRAKKHKRWVAMRRELMATGGSEAVKLYSDLRDYFDQSFEDQINATIERLLKTEADKLQLRKVEGTESFFDHAAIAQLRKAVRANRKMDDIIAALVATNPEELNADDPAVRGLARSIRGIVGRRKRKGPYFPLRRYGEYVVNGTKTTEHTFSTPEEAKKFRNAVNSNTADGFTAYARARYKKKVAQENQTYTVEVKEQITQFYEGRDAARKAAAALEATGEYDAVEATIKNAFMQDSGNIEGAASFAEHLKSTLRKGVDGKADSGIIAAIDRSVLQLIETNAARSAQMNRQNIAGASADMFRAIAEQADSNAWVVADMATITEQAELMSRMRTHSKGKFARAGGVDPTDVVNHLNKREERSVEVDRVGGLVEDVVTRVGYYWYLASLSYSMVNMMQVFATGLPHMLGKYGVVRGTKHFAANMGIAGKAGAKELLRTNLGFSSVPELYMETVVGGDLNVNTKDKAGALSQLTRMGLIDATFIQELHSAREPGDWARSQFLHYATTWARSLPQLVEQFNRVTMGGAAYDAAREKGATHEAATEEARQAIIQTQFDYSGMNRPLAFKALPFSRIVFMFKMYGQGMYSLFARHLAGAMGKGTAPRSESIRFMASYATVNAMAAGVLGGVVSEPLKMVAELIATLVGDDDDGVAWQTEFKTALYEQALAFGATKKQAANYADMVAYGLPRWSREYGVDLSSRMGTDHLAFMPVMNKEDTFENAMVERVLQLVGPMGSVLRNMFKGMDRIKEGRGAEALEGMMPKGMRDIARAIRRYDSPQLSASGRETLEGQTGVQSAWQAIGFTPTADARRYEDMGAQYDYETKLTKARTNLTRQFYRAEGKERNAIWRDKIVPWNKQHRRDPKLQISYKQLNQGLKRNREAERDAVGGMTPRLDSTRKAIPFAGRE